jgi:hypothetical protein
MKDTEFERRSMPKIPINRLCPVCEKDAGQTAENYGTLSGIFQYTNCANCRAHLVSAFKYPNFYWKSYE